MIPVNKKTKQALEMDELLKPERFDPTVTQYPSDYFKPVPPCNGMTSREWRGLQDLKEDISTMSGGTKHDDGKVPLGLIDASALHNIAAVLDFGRKKYGEHNWRRGFRGSRLADAALRHVYAWVDGEDFDPESGLSHLAHAGCCIVFMLGLLASGRLVDDRHTATAPQESAGTASPDAGTSVYLQESAE